MTMACNYDLLNVHMEAIKLSQSWPCKRPDEDKEDHTYYIPTSSGAADQFYERNYEITIYKTKYRKHSITFAAYPAHIALGMCVA